MTTQILLDGTLVTLSPAEATAMFPPPPPSSPQTVFAPRQVIETLFTPAEQQAIYTAAMSMWQVAKFISLVTAMPQVDITDPEFVADVHAVEALGLLTADRTSQILAGTSASP